MILSKYLNILEKDRVCLIYNFINGKIIKIDKEIYSLLLSKKFEVLDSKLIHYLIENLFLVEKNRFSLSDYNNRIAININITNKCNFKCNYCYFSKLNDLNENILCFNLDDFRIWYKTLVDSKRNFKYIDIVFLGGEPLLSFNRILKITEIVKEISNNKILHFEVITNGYFLDNYVINKLEEIGDISIQITFDGGRNEHNSTRKHLGKYDSYDVLIEKIKKTIKHIEVIIRVNFSQNVEFNSIIEMLKELKKIGVKYLYFSHIEHNYIRIENSYEISIIENYKKLWKIQLDLGFMLFQPLPSVVTNCIAKNKNSYTINYDGKLYMCPVSCGNKKYLEGSIDNLFLKKRIGYSSTKVYEELCENCNLFPICFGGCPYNELSQNLTVDLNCKKKFISTVINEYLTIKYF